MIKLVEFLFKTYKINGKQSQSSFIERLQKQPLLLWELCEWGSGARNMNASQIENFIEGCISMDLIDFDHADIYGSYTTEADFGPLKDRI